MIYRRNVISPFKTKPEKKTESSDDINMCIILHDNIAAGNSIEVECRRHSINQKKKKKREKKLVGLNVKYILNVVRSNKIESSINAFEPEATRN